MRRPIVAANWKMHGSRAFAESMLTSLRDASGVVGAKADVVICPPFPLLESVGKLIGDSGIELGAQDLSEHPEGAFTGEVSAAMLVDAGCSHVIVGHSERRALHRETDKDVVAKFVAAADAGLVPIFCLGETQGERESDQTELVVTAQLDSLLDAVEIGKIAGSVFAYEPVWAIGTGLTATPEQAQEVHALIRARVAARNVEVAEGLRILYGGSVKAANAAELFGKPDIDGGLVGGASLKSEEFIGICGAAQ